MQHSASVLLENDPGDAEQIVRDALPLMAKSYNGTNRPDLSKLTDHELKQLKNALLAAAAQSSS